MLLGYELLTDLCLAEVLLKLGLASRIHLHAKRYFWFVSDTTPADIQYCLSQLHESDLLVPRGKSEEWSKRFSDGTQCRAIFILQLE